MLKAFGKIAYFFPGLLVLALLYNNLGPGWETYGDCYVFYLFISLFLITGLSAMLFVKEGMAFSWSYIDIAFVLFASYAFISVLVHKEVHFFDERVLTGIYILSAYPLLKIIFTQETGRKILSHSVFAAGAFMSFYGLAQLTPGISSFVRSSRSFGVAATGPFGNPGPYAWFLAVTIPFSVYTLLTAQRANRKNFRAVVLASLCIAGVLLVLTLSRAAWLAVFVSLSFLLVRQGGWNKKIRASWFIMLTCAAMLTVALLPLNTNSTRGRVLIWKVSLAMWKEAPITGLGPNQFLSQYNNYQAAFFRNNGDDNVYAPLANNTYYAFNDFMELAVELGVVGLILCIVLLLTALWKSNAKTQPHPFTLSAQATILCFCTLALFSYPLSNIPVLVIGLSCVAALSAQAQRGKILINPPFIKMGALIFNAFIILLTWNVAVRYVAIRRWKEASHQISWDDRAAAFRIYENVYPTLQHDREFLFNYGAELSEAGAYKKSTLILERARSKFNPMDLYVFLGNSHRNLKQFKDAENAYVHASHMIPNRFVPKYLLVQVYLETNETDKAVELAKKIVNTRVKIPSPIVMNIKTEMRELIEKYEHVQE